MRQWVKVSRRGDAKRIRRTGDHAGSHGLVSYAVAKRVHEIGIRMAIGARPSQVLQLVLARMGALLAAGAALGLILALAGGQVLASILFQASPRDPLVLIVVIVTVFIVGLLS